MLTEKSSEIQDHVFATWVYLEIWNQHMFLYIPFLDIYICWKGIRTHVDAKTRKCSVMFVRLIKKNEHLKQNNIIRNNSRNKSSISEFLEKKTLWHFLCGLKGAARYAGLLLTPAEGFGLLPRLFCPLVKEESFSRCLCLLRPFWVFSSNLRYF